MSIRAPQPPVNQRPGGRFTPLALFDGLLPERCALCAGGSGLGGLCEPCRAGLPRVAAACAVCGIPGHPAAAAHGPGWHLGGVLAPFRHAFPVRDLVHRLKYRGHRQLGRALGLLLADHLTGRELSADALVPMPLHRSRLIARGYNQSFELARTLARETGQPVWVGGIRRVRATAPQATLSGGARRANVAGAFRVTRPLAGARVLLVDDVITTGATANALAGALLAAGAASVALIAVARG